VRVSGVGEILQIARCELQARLRLRGVDVVSAYVEAIALHKNNRDLAMKVTSLQLAQEGARGHEDDQKNSGRPCVILRGIPGCRSRSATGTTANA
jgi:hypothetical protein